MLAALACAVCNGSAAMLIKVSADKERNVAALDVRLLIRLLQNKRYLLSIVLNIIGWAFCLFALQYLPLFLVGAIIAANIVITALLEKAFLKQEIRQKSYVSICTVLAGLTLLAVAAAPTKAKPLGHGMLLSMVLAPVLIALIGYALSRWKNYRSTCSLAVLSGLSFGVTSVAGRALHITPPVHQILTNPLLIVIVACTVLGSLIFSTALQRAQATVMNAFMSASQTLVPAAAGLLFLGDSARTGFGFLIALGSLLVVGGVVHLALQQQTAERLVPEYAA
jgi:drug/metabolite transporter (DMT)-like permease